MSGGDSVRVDTKKHKDLSAVHVRNANAAERLDSGEIVVHAKSTSLELLAKSVLLGF